MSESQVNYLYTLKNAHLSSNSYNFWMQPNIAKKFAGYDIVAWILLCKCCKLGEKNYYNSRDIRDIKFFLGDYFFGGPCTLTQWHQWIMITLIILNMLTLYNSLQQCTVQDWRSKVTVKYADNKLIVLSHIILSYFRWRQFEIAESTVQYIVSAIEIVYFCSTRGIVTPMLTIYY